MFTPEFRNRLDAIISFRALDEEIILRVVDKFLMQLEEQLHEKKVEAIFTEKLRTFLAKKGFDPLMGARPMSRLIQDMIRKALAERTVVRQAGDRWSYRRWISMRRIRSSWNSRNGMTRHRRLRSAGKARSRSNAMATGHLHDGEKAGTFQTFRLFCRQFLAGSG